MSKSVWIERRSAVTLRRTVEATWRSGEEHSLMRLAGAAREGLARFARANSPNDEHLGVPQRVVLRGAVAGLLGRAGAQTAPTRFAAARLMRRVLVEQPPGRPLAEDIRSFDHALDQLRQRDSLSADIIELHYFGGQLPAEIAQALNTPVTLVLDNLRFCKAWLAAQMQRQYRAQQSQWSWRDTVELSCLRDCRPA